MAKGLLNFVTYPLSDNREKQFPLKRIRYVQFTLNGVTLDHCWWSRCKFWSVTSWSGVADVMSCHIMSWCHWSIRGPCGHPQFFITTHDQKELETWACFHCVCLVSTHWMINNIYVIYVMINVIYVDYSQLGLPRDLNLRSNVDLIFQGHHANI